MTSLGQINTDLVDWREKPWEAFEDIAPNDVNCNEGQNLEVVPDDEDHEDTVTSKLWTSETLQHLDKLLGFSIAKNDETLSRLLPEKISAVENIKTLPLWQSNIPSSLKKS